MEESVYCLEQKLSKNTPSPSRAFPVDTGQVLVFSSTFCEWDFAPDPSSHGKVFLGTEASPSAGPWAAWDGCQRSP